MEKTCVSAIFFLSLLLSRKSVHVSGALPANTSDRQAVFFFFNSSNYHEATHTAHFNVTKKKAKKYSPASC